MCGMAQQTFGVACVRPTSILDQGDRTEIGRGPRRMDNTTRDPVQWHPSQSGLQALQFGRTFSLADPTVHGGVAVGGVPPCM